MGNPTGFKQFTRTEIPHRPVSERIKDWYEIDQPLVDNVLNEQAARCMDCGIPFCHGAGCPVKNRIPEFNDLVYRGHWQAAAENLHSTNNFPEVTGRVCPAPCETACTLAINDRAVTIKHIEYQIAERAFSEGWVEPILPTTRTGKRVAIIGSGPAGLAAAQQVNRAGHETVVFEKDDRIGGLLRYGIPDFKLEKRIIDRRLEQMSREGVRFQSGVEVGRDITAAELRSQFDAVCLCMGAGQARPLNVTGADLRGVHLAMDFLSQQNRRVAGDPEYQVPHQPAGKGPVL
ncbi:MAG: glutamate synthase subunit beta, partial [Thermoguttaceae bacterium]